MQRLRQFFRQPKFVDPQLNRAARIFYTIAYILLIPLPLWLIVVVFSDDPMYEGKVPQFVGGVLLLVVVVGLMALVRRGKVRIASFLLILYIWASLALQVIVTQLDLRSPQYVWFLIVILIAGLTIGNTGMIVFVVASVLLVSGIYLADTQDVTDFTGVSVEIAWSLYAVGYVVAAIFLGIALRETSLALKRAQRSESRWRSLVESAPDYVIQLDMNDGVSYVNRHEIDVSREKLVGKRFYELILPAHQPMIQQALSEVRRSNSHSSVKISAQLGHEGHRTYNVIVSPILVEGQIVSIVALMHDITDEEQMEQRQRELELMQTRNQAMEQAIDELTHDLKTPLSTMMTSLYILERKVGTEESKPRFITLRQQVDNINQIVNDLLTISRLERVDQSLFQPVAIGDLAQEIIDEVRPWAEEKQIKVFFETIRNLFVNGIDRELRRAIQNLLENGIHYTPQGGQVNLRVLSSDGLILIVVEDTGVGIPPEDLAHIFDRYYRTKLTREMRPDGTGLGLAIVKKVIDLHNGKISVESHLGKGTYFRIYLPQVQIQVVDSKVG